MSNLQNLRNPADIKKILTDLDVDRSGSIDYSGKVLSNKQEFMAATLNRDIYELTSKLETTFKDFDRN